MQNIKSNPILTACQAALADDNIEQCITILMENFPGNNHVISFSGQAKGLLNKKWQGILNDDAFTTERNKIRHSLLEFLDSLKELNGVATKSEESKIPSNNERKELEASLILSGIHERILIVKCKNSPTDWERIFPDTRYTHVAFMKYGEPIPVGFSNPDVVVFDDLNCPGLLGNKNEMRRLAEEMPTSYLLYVGESGGNPFQDSKLKEEQAIFARMNHANSRLTVPSRLNELLEFRKNYGQPLTTIILENMKDKLPLRVFISYSHRDEEWKNDLDIHLANMKRQGLISVWQDRKILPGSEWDEAIKKQLEESHLILLLLSPGFMASEYIQDKEVEFAMSLYHAGKAKVIPVFVKHCEWKGAVFGKLQGLPRDERFLDTLPNKDQGLATVAKELRELIENWGK